MAATVLLVRSWRGDVLGILMYLGRYGGGAPDASTEMTVVEVADFFVTRLAYVPPDLAALHPADLLPLPADPFLSHIVMLLYFDTMYRYSSPGDAPVHGEPPNEWEEAGSDDYEEFESDSTDGLPDAEEAAEEEEAEEDKTEDVEGETSESADGSHDDWRPDEPVSKRQRLCWSL